MFYASGCWARPQTIGKGAHFIAQLCVAYGLASICPCPDTYAVAAKFHALFLLVSFLFARFAKSHCSKTIEDMTEVKISPEIRVKTWVRHREVR